jgi:hypothetical protein
MKLALYLPNLRDKITVSEIVDLAREAEALDFDSVWSLALNVPITASISRAFSPQTCSSTVASRVCSDAGMTSPPVCPLMALCRWGGAQQCASLL